ncbi:unnamed protein product [Discula destructiva]
MSSLVSNEDMDLNHYKRLLIKAWAQVITSLPGTYQNQSASKAVVDLSFIFASLCNVIPSLVVKKEAMPAALDWYLSSPVNQRQFEIRYKTSARALGCFLAAPSVEAETTAVALRGASGGPAVPPGIIEAGPTESVTPAGQPASGSGPSSTTDSPAGEQWIHDRTIADDSRPTAAAIDSVPEIQMIGSGSSRDPNAAEHHTQRAAQAYAHVLACLRSSSEFPIYFQESLSDLAADQVDFLLEQLSHNADNGNQVQANNRAILEWETARRRAAQASPFDGPLTGR